MRASLVVRSLTHLAAAGVRPAVHHWLTVLPAVNPSVRTGRVDAHDWISSLHLKFAPSVEWFQHVVTRANMQLGFEKGIQGGAAGGLPAVCIDALGIRAS